MSNIRRAYATDGGNLALSDEVTPNPLPAIEVFRSGFTKRFPRAPVLP